jgi:hypothetical protein
MEGGAGLEGQLPSRFEDGLRFLAAALALRADRRSLAAATTAACSAIRCFLDVLEAAARRHLEDPRGDVERLRAQCQALLVLSQAPQDALEHALEAARLARDEASRILVLLVAR